MCLLCSLLLLGLYGLLHLVCWFLVSSCAGCVSPVVGVVLFAIALYDFVVWLGLLVVPGWLPSSE